MKLQEKLLQFLLDRNRDTLIESHYQKRIEALYVLSWNVPLLSECSMNKYNRKFTLERLQKELQKNKGWFLSYLDSYCWNHIDKDRLEKYRTYDVMAAYLVYDKSLNPLEKLHIAKYYCEGYIDMHTSINQMALTEMASQSYLQNSLHESGKSSYVKK